MRRDNTSGYKGVSPDTDSIRWVAQVQFRKVKIRIGKFYTPVEAALARIKWEDNCEGWNCEHNSPTRTKLRLMGYDV